MIERIQGASRDGIDTHNTTYFRKIWRQIPCLVALNDENTLRVADPFARDCTLAYPYTNDVDESTSANYHQDAREFLRNVCPSNYFDLILFDPPFSRSQELKYNGTQNVYSTPGFVPDCMESIHRILKTGGYLLKFGYNSTRHHPSFFLVKTWLANMGANRNDVIVTLWQKTNTTLEDW